MALKKIIIDDQEIEVPTNLALIQACEEAGVEIPRFCYHERLSVAGNCRMCLVEVKGIPKPQASCAVTVGDLRGGANGEPPVVSTKSAMVKKAREGVMEFLLANHPLDCPICDQGGECDLQDQAMVYGTDKSRFEFGKRAVEDKNLGPLVKTAMTRCIHCTRCVRFSTEVAGSPELGAIYRGEETEITPYLENIVTSELSANIIDLCPVGALTSKPYAFVARPWEMTKTESIDVTDAMGSAIIVQARGNEVMRITPRNDDDVNEEWISNKARFVVDGLKRQRLDRPYIRKEGRLVAVSWEEVLDYVAQRLGQTEIKSAFIAGSHTDIETLYAAKALAKTIGAVTEGRAFDALPADNIFMGRFNPRFASVDSADAILLVGTNPRLEAAVLNARIRKTWLNNKADIAVIGEKSDLTYDYTYLGKDATALQALICREHKFVEKLQQAKNPLIIVGEGALKADGVVVLKLLQVLMETLKLPKEAYAYLPTSMAQGGVLELGFTHEGGLSDIYRSVAEGTIGTIFALGADELAYPALEKAFKIYMGTHGDNGAHHADVILPSATYIEKDATYISAEGRVRKANKAVFPVGEAKPDWAILRALSEHLSQTLPFDSLEELRHKLFAECPALEQTDMIISHPYKQIDVAQAESSGIYHSIITEYYMTDAVVRASKVLRECQKSFYGVQEKLADAVSV